MSEASDAIIEATARAYGRLQGSVDCFLNGVRDEKWLATRVVEIDKDRTASIEAIVKGEAS